MHATIAALSSGVPSAAVAYSNKTAGVFETCRQGDHVADPREFGTSEMLERLWWSWERRAEARRVLHAALPEVLFKADAQMDKIAAIICARSAARRGAA
jgi:colanic acid/amylovoran biosynthesis protein